MRTRKTALTIGMLFVGLTMCFAQNPNLGTWKLNEAKSKIGAGLPKNTTVRYEAVGDKIKVTVDGVDPQGNATHNEWTGKFDGKDYPITGDPTSDARSYEQVNARTVELTNKKAGKITISGRIRISADGKTRTLVANGHDSTGKKTQGTSVYDKQ
jgi:hypothetical protein